MHSSDVFTTDRLHAVRVLHFLFCSVCTAQMGVNIACTLPSPILVVSTHPATRELNRT